MREALESDRSSAEDPGLLPILRLDHELDVIVLSQEGQRFDKVAQEYSEDKAKGMVNGRQDRILGCLVYLTFI